MSWVWNLQYRDKTGAIKKFPALFEDEVEHSYDHSEATQLTVSLLWLSARYWSSTPSNRAGAAERKQQFKGGLETRALWELAPRENTTVFSYSECDKTLLS